MSKNRVFLRLLFLMIGVAFLAALVWFAKDLGKQKTYKFVYIPKVQDEENGFWTSLIAGVEMGAQDHNVELEVKGPKSENDVQTQIELISESIEKDPDAILVSPNHLTGLREVLQEVKEKDIRLIFVDSVSEPNIADAIVETDNYAAGRLLGEYVKNLVTEDSQIGVVGHVEGSSTAIEREAGMKAGLSEDAARIQEIQYCDSSFEKAYEIAGEMIDTYPKLDILVGTNEYASVGVARAVKDRGLKNQIKVVGFDSSLEETQLLEEGIFQAIVIQRPFNMGYLGIEQAVKVVKGAKAEKSLDSGCKLITKANMYEDENQKLLYPFTEK